MPPYCTLQPSLGDCKIQEIRLPSRMVLRPGQRLAQPYRSESGPRAPGRVVSRLRERRVDVTLGAFFLANEGETRR
jgi:hypothetical protein